MTAHETTEILEFGEARAAADMMAAAPSTLASQLGLKTTSIASATILAAKTVPITMFNRVIGLGVGEPVTATHVDEILTYLREYASPRFAFQISPRAESSELVHWLTARGLQFTNHWAKVIRSGTQLPFPTQTSLRVEAVDEHQAATFGKVFVEGYGVPEIFGTWLAAMVGRPRWQHYLAYDGDIPIATGSLYIEDDIGWLGIAATLAVHREKGAQSAIIAKRIEDGLAMGCQWFISETEEDTPTWRNPSFHNLLRFGFELAYLRPNFEPVQK